MLSTNLHVQDVILEKRTKILTGRKFSLCKHIYEKKNCFDNANIECFSILDNAQTR